MDRHERLEAVRRMGERKRLDLKRLHSIGPGCQFCVFGPDDGTARGVCSHPIHMEASAKPVSGDFEVKSLVSTIKARSEGGLCGPEGLLFEARAWPVRVWRAIRPRLLS